MTKAAINGISHLKKPNCSLVKYRTLQSCFLCACGSSHHVLRRLRKGIHEICACCLDLVLFVLVCCTELKQYGLKTRQVIMAVFWEIGSNIEWLLIWRQKNR